MRMLMRFYFILTVDVWCCLTGTLCDYTDHPCNNLRRWAMGSHQWHHWLYIPLFSYHSSPRWHIQWIQSTYGGQVSQHWSYHPKTGYMYCRIMKFHWGQFSLIVNSLKVCLVLLGCNFVDLLLSSVSYQ